jgi:hypothetical protein
MISKAARSYRVFCQLVKIVKVFQVHEDLAGREVFSIKQRLDQSRVNFFSVRTQQGFLVRVQPLDRFKSRKRDQYRIPYSIWTPWGSLTQEARDDILWPNLINKVLIELNVLSAWAFYGNKEFPGFSGWVHEVNELNGETVNESELTEYWDGEVFGGCDDGSLEDLRSESNQEHTDLRELWNKHCTQWLKENGHF